MNPPESSSPGFTGALRSLADGLLASLRDRVALVAVELEEERCRLIQTLVWISAAMFAGMMAIGFASFTLVYLFQDSARLAVLLTLTGVFTVSFVVILLTFRRACARQPRPLAGTLEELEEDRRCTRGPR